MNLRQLRRIGFDLLVVVGAAVFVYGCWLAWRPLGWMVGGAALITMGFFAGYERPAARTESEE